MGQNISEKMGKGITPDQFIAGMEQNKEKFLEWYERFRWMNEEDQQFFSSYVKREELRCHILAAEWCGDVVRNVPVVLQILQTAGIQTEIFIMEKHTDLMDQFLTMGGRAIPIVIMTDQTGRVLGQWGPRPKHVQEAMVRFKQENTDRNAPDYDEKLRETYSEMMKRYGQGIDYQQIIIDEWREWLAAL